MRSALLMCLLLVLSGCGQEMAEQPKYQALESAERFPDNRAARRPPANTVPRDAAFTGAAQPPMRAI